MQNSIETRGNLCTELLTELGPWTACVRTHLEKH